ncbi:MAG: tRNA 2-thiocytidine(32) synthetase TtcA [Firmicutes bacterium]|nr:tRNA 2-thiocytidine(32) synthetase TtcA [Bacillota bacterium]
MGAPFHQHLFPLVKRAMRDYDMLHDGDSVAVGVSGGKDSLTTLYTLARLRRMLPIKFELHAISVDMGWPGSDWSDVAAFCRDQDVPFHLVKTEIAQVLFDLRKETNPCSLCSKLRHGALNSEAVRLGCHKVALGHHREDAVETLFLNMIYNGRIDCFKPVTWLDRRELYLIRPLVYVSENTTRRVAAKLELPVLHNPCPADGYTKRQQIKELLAAQAATDKNVPKRLLTAVKSLWV